MNLEIGLRELHNKEKVEQLNFWGKITGEEGNYYIALGLNYTNHYEFPEKNIITLHQHLSSKFFLKHFLIMTMTSLQVIQSH